MTLTTMDDLSRSLAEIENLKRVCEALMKTPHYAKLGPEGVFAVVSKANSLGMNHAEALNGALYYLQGKVGMGAETMSALIRSKGHSIMKDSKSNDQICILHGKRADNGDTWTSSFSMDDARRAGLVKNSYDKYPAAMLYNRAMSFLARQLFPDVIKGAGYTLDELKEIATSKNDINPISDNYQSDMEYISEKDAEHIENMLKECSTEYQVNFWMFLKKQIPGIESLRELPKNMHERISKAVAKKKEENEKTIQVDPEGMVVNE